MVQPTKRYTTMMCFGIFIWVYNIYKCNGDDTFIASVSENKYLTVLGKKSKHLHSGNPLIVICFNRPGPWFLSC